ncbi:amino acid/amide ABC transporter substrate-binding protein, HAAT family [Cryptosporangium aurantiacum]|uniref:Amino acid/amide ABC transporter substrate-binding protein, HAAT family n=1 Tax=Cryptosporangium aurantiacum TaxID=134849 RepID=A0A1M7IBX1_9ACTN|nr:amino acid/amide ABC transporter substrate-binding protein, HAAT family [Cryptosporangium aurantiacum]
MRLRNLARVAAVGAAIALAATGCSSGGDDDGDTTASGDKACGLTIAFVGAQTGGEAALGINISNGAQLAVDQYNEKNADCKVTLKKFDSEGKPEKASTVVPEVVQDEKIVGVVGPAFSGETKATGPTFEEAGLPIITASATNPALAENGWKIFHRILGNDAAQGPQAALYIKNDLKASKVYVVDDASEYGKGLSDIVKKDLGSVVVGSDTVQDGQTDFSAVVTKIKSSGATALFYGGYYDEAGLLRKQLTQAGGQAITLIAGDGVKDTKFVDGAGTAAAEGTIVTCPCLPPEKAPGTFFEDYKKAFNAEPSTYSAEAFDAATVFLDGIADGKSTRADMLEFVKAYDKQGITKQVKFDAKGEVADKGVWAYKFEGGKIVALKEIK